MKTSPLILITGASGKTGLATTLSLLEQSDVRIRALVRKNDHRAQNLHKLGAEIVIGNMNDIRDMRKAMQGVQRAYFVAPFSNNSLDHAMNFFIAAEEAKLAHIVLLGQWLSSPSHPSILTRRTWLLDRLVTWIPNVNHTIINVGWFADNYMSVLSMAAQFGVLPLPLGEGKTAPVSTEDIGRVAAGVLIDPTPYAGMTLRPTGSELLSPQQIAATFSEVLNRKVKYIHISERMVSKTLRALGENQFMHAQGLQYVRDYQTGSLEIGAPNDIVEQVTGRPAEDFKSILTRYAAQDPTARKSLGNALKVLLLMVRTGFMRPMNVEQWKQKHDIPKIQPIEYCADSTEWKESHV